MGRKAKISSYKAKVTPTYNLIACKLASEQKEVNTNAKNNENIMNIMTDRDIT